MKKRNRQINIFNLSMLDVITGALGAFVIMVVLLLPYYRNDELLRDCKDKLVACQGENLQINTKYDKCLDQSQECEKLKEKVLREKGRLAGQLERCRETNEQLAGGQDSLSNQYQKCREQYEELFQQHAESTDQLADCRDVNERAQEEQAQNEDRLARCRETLAGLQEDLRGAQKAQRQQDTQLDECRQTIGGLEEDLRDANERAQEVRRQNERQLGECRGTVAELREDVRKLGFALKERHVVFVVDISGSMKDDNKIHEVMSGIKMQIATMDDSYQTDVVFFPNQKKHQCFSTVHPDYGCMWNGLTQVSVDKKYDAYTFLSKLVPLGATPTESALNFVLENYPEAGAIILFSDGTPTVGNTPLSWNELKGLLERVTDKNGGRKKINTIGVGPDFRDKDRMNDDPVRFLRILAEKNNGFYSGF